MQRLDVRVGLVRNVYVCCKCKVMPGEPDVTVNNDATRTGVVLGVRHCDFCVINTDAVLVLCL
jgi:hypothetical protein